MSDQPQGLNSKTRNVADIVAKAISDVQLVGPEIVNETPTMVYSLRINLQTKTSYTGTAKVWLGVTDGLLRQMEIQSTVTGESGDQAQIQTQITYEYDPSIKIEPPAL